MSQEEQKVKESKGMSVSGAIIVAGIIIAGAVFATNSQSVDLASTSQEATAVQATNSTQLLNKITKDDFIQGAEKPKVTIVEFSDFGCSFCSHFHPTLQSIVDEYPGDVAWVYRHLPYRNKDAALASECVGQKLGDEAFWSYSTTLFQAFPDVTAELLRAEAIALGLDGEEFDTCIASEEIEDTVSADAAEAQLLGASGTPFSLIVTDDGRTFPLRGAVQSEQIKQIIDVLIK